MFPEEQARRKEKLSSKLAGSNSKEASSSLSNTNKITPVLGGETSSTRARNCDIGGSSSSSSTINSRSTSGGPTNKKYSKMSAPTSPTTGAGGNPARGQPALDDLPPPMSGRPLPPPGATGVSYAVSYGTPVVAIDNAPASRRTSSGVIVMERSTNGTVRFPGHLQGSPPPHAQHATAMPISNNMIEMEGMVGENANLVAHNSRTKKSRGNHQQLGIQTSQGGPPTTDNFDPFEHAVKPEPGKTALVPQQGTVLSPGSNAVLVYKDYNKQEAVVDPVLVGGVVHNNQRTCSGRVSIRKVMTAAFSVCLGAAVGIAGYSMFFADGGGGGDGNDVASAGMFGGGGGGSDNRQNPASNAATGQSGDRASSIGTPAGTGSVVPDPEVAATGYLTPEVYAELVGDATATPPPPEAEEQVEVDLVAQNVDVPVTLSWEGGDATAAAAAVLQDPDLQAGFLEGFCSVLGDAFAGDNCAQWVSIVDVKPATAVSRMLTASDASSPSADVALDVKYEVTVADDATAEVVEDFVEEVDETVIKAALETKVKEKTQGLERFATLQIRSIKKMKAAGRKETKKKIPKSMLMGGDSASSSEDGSSASSGSGASGGSGSGGSSSGSGASGSSGTGSSGSGNGSGNKGDVGFRSVIPSAKWDLSTQMRAAACNMKQTPESVAKMLSALPDSDPGLNPTSWTHSPLPQFTQLATHSTVADAVEDHVDGVLRSFEQVFGELPAVTPGATKPQIRKLYIHLDQGQWNCLETDLENLQKDEEREKFERKEQISKIKEKEQKVRQDRQKEQEKQMERKKMEAEARKKAAEERRKAAEKKKQEAERLAKEAANAADEEARLAAEKMKRDAEMEERKAKRDEDKEKAEKTKMETRKERVQKQLKRERAATDRTKNEAAAAEARKRKEHAETREDREKAEDEELDSQDNAVFARLEEAQVSAEVDGLLAEEEVQRAIQLKLDGETALEDAQAKREDFEKAWKKAVEKADQAAASADVGEQVKTQLQEEAEKVKDEMLKEFEREEKAKAIKDEMEAKIEEMQALKEKKKKEAEKFATKVTEERAKRMAAREERMKKRAEAEKKRREEEAEEARKEKERLEARAKAAKDAAKKKELEEQAKEQERKQAAAEERKKQAEEKRKQAEKKEAEAEAARKKAKEEREKKEREEAEAEKKRQEARERAKATEQAKQKKDQEWADWASRDQNNKKNAAANTEDKNKNNVDEANAPKDTKNGDGAGAGDNNNKQAQENDKKNTSPVNKQGANNNEKKNQLPWWMQNQNTNKKNGGKRSLSGLFSTMKLKRLARKSSYDEDVSDKDGLVQLRRRADEQAEAKADMSKADKELWEKEWAHQQHEAEDMEKEEQEKERAHVHLAHKKRRDHRKPMTVPATVSYTPVETLNHGGAGSDSGMLSTTDPLLYSHVGLKFIPSNPENGKFFKGMKKRNLVLDFGKWKNKQRFFGFKRLILHTSMGRDRSRMQEKLMSDLYALAGLAVPHTQFYVVYMSRTEDGIVPASGSSDYKYLGVFTALEDPNDTVRETGFFQEQAKGVEVEDLAARWEDKAYDIRAEWKATIGMTPKPEEETTTVAPPSGSDSRVLRGRELGGSAPGALVAGVAPSLGHQQSFPGSPLRFLQGSSSRELQVDNPFFHQTGDLYSPTPTSSRLLIKERVMKPTDREKEPLETPELNAEAFKIRVEKEKLLRAKTDNSTDTKEGLREYHLLPKRVVNGTDSLRPFQDYRALVDVLNKLPRRSKILRTPIIPEDDGTGTTDGTTGGTTGTDADSTSGSEDVLRALQTNNDKSTDEKKRKRWRMHLRYDSERDPTALVWRSAMRKALDTYSFMKYLAVANAFAARGQYGHKTGGYRLYNSKVGQGARFSHAGEPIVRPAVMPPTEWTAKCGDITCNFSYQPIAQTRPTESQLHPYSGRLTWMPTRFTNAFTRNWKVRELNYKFVKPGWPLLQYTYEDSVLRSYYIHALQTMTGEKDCANAGTGNGPQPRKGLKSQWEYFFDSTLSEMRWRCVSAASETPTSVAQAAFARIAAVGRGQFTAGDVLGNLVSRTHAPSGILNEALLHGQVEYYKNVLLHFTTDEPRDLEEEQEVGAGESLVEDAEETLAEDAEVDFFFGQTGGAGAVTELLPGASSSAGSGASDSSSTGVAGDSSAATSSGSTGTDVDSTSDDGEPPVLTAEQEAEQLDSADQTEDSTALGVGGIFDLRVGGSVVSTSSDVGTGGSTSTDTDTDATTSLIAIRNTNSTLMQAATGSDEKKKPLDAKEAFLKGVTQLKKRLTNRVNVVKKGVKMLIRREVRRTLYSV
ncbi:unnamed protein product [Amoebophrya sp. A25]|nr:unnamed protein product [Amoebophrya sp. A25]|eukprot:GSA25T00008015001.1